MKPGTPLPWSMRHNPDPVICAGHTPAIATPNSVDAFEREQNAAYAVHAANLYPELVEALEDAYKLLAYDEDTDPEDLRANIDQTRRYLCAVLAKAEADSTDGL